MQLSKIKKDKRGMFFTILTIFILTIFLLSFHYQRRLTDRSIAERIRTMNSFIQSVERDTGRGIYISGFRTILLMQDYITKEGVFIENVSYTFSRAFFNGTFNGNSSRILEASTFSNWENAIKIKAEELNINMNISAPQLKIYHEDPWHVTLELDFNMLVNDSTGIAYWDKEEKVKTKISIEGFEDPLYTIYTSGKVPNVINKTIYEGNYVSGTNITNLSKHALNSYYASNSLAPSFLMRLEGNISSSLYGIESMVNLVEFSEQDLPVYERSVIDYIYFSAQPTTNYRIAGMSSWFRLDNEHLDKYQARSLAS